MAKFLRCEDFMVKCSYAVRGTTEEDVLRQATSHLAEVHHIKELTPRVQPRCGLSMPHDQPSSSRRSLAERRSQARPSNRPFRPMLALTAASWACTLNPSVPGQGWSSRSRTADKETP
jgi:predicted small metal-binding protein